MTLVLGLSGCTDSGPGTNDSAPSPTSTSNKTAQPNTPSPRTGAELARTLAAAVDAKGVAHTTFSVRAHDTIKGSGVIRFKNGTGQSGEFSYALTRNGAAQRYRLVIVDDLLYLKPPPATSLPAGKSWIRVRVGASDPVSRSFLPLISEVTQFDPTSDLSALRKVRTVRVIGDEMVGGTRSTHYTTRLDLPLLGDVFGSRAGRDARYELWVDGRSLPTKYTVSTTLPGVGIITFAGDFTDWGRYATVSRPPASSVVKAETLR
jgi:hypothetical protein